MPRHKNPIHTPVSLPIPITSRSSARSIRCDGFGAEVGGGEAAGGVRRALVGRKRVSGKELFQKMLDEADGMMTAMSGGGAER